MENNKTRRNINFEIDDFNKIKLYCDKNCYKITKWATKILLEENNKKGN